MNCSTIIGIRLNQRSASAPRVQEVLTTKGCIIKTRLGVHEGCDDEGLILLQVCGEPEAIQELEGKLCAIPEVRVASMTV